MTGPNFFAPEAQILGRSSFWKAAFFFVAGTVMILVSIVFLMVSFDAGEDVRLQVNCLGFGTLFGVGGLVFLIFGAYWSTNNPSQVIIVQQSAANQSQQAQYIPSQQKTRFSKQPSNQQPPRYP